MNKLKHIVLAALTAWGVTCGVSAQNTKAAPGNVWTIEKAKAWYAKHPWLAGANFIPSTAINQLEMWQADTFDPTTIDRELGYAEGVGFNAMRVFLHSVAYQADPKGFKTRVDKYLAIANKHHIETIFVFFDDCWNANPKAGKQPEPKPGIHNSGWAQDPGVRMVTDPKMFARLQAYVKDVMSTFKHDKRVLLWDLYNEPGNSGKRDSSFALLSKVFSWARDVNPDQPISAGLWAWDFEKLNAFQALNSDVITYHDYSEEPSHHKTLQLLKSHGRPLICTEYMARTRNSTFATVMPMLKKENVGAINWGLVDGKTNTKYAWDTPLKDGSEPKVWFHEVFRKDGTPYSADETQLIKKTTGR